MTHILSAVAWPYANGPRHIGHVAGFGVPSDVFSRYMRMAGHDVLMVSGTDEHGTPILVAADEEGLTIMQIVEALGLLQPTVSMSVSALVEDGMVERERRGAGVSATTVSLTEKGACGRPFLCLYIYISLYYCTKNAILHSLALVARPSGWHIHHSTFPAPCLGRMEGPHLNAFLRWRWRAAGEQER